jgi:hypothetical protein
MPELSRFLGIVIAMYYRDHGPAHFHAIYGDFEITVEIETGRINGDFPKRALTNACDGMERLAPRRTAGGLVACASQSSAAAH